MKVLGLVIGRRNETGEYIAKTALLGAQEAGCEVELINLRQLTIKPCIECNQCQDPPLAYNGQCTMKDDFQWLDEKILDSDGIVIVLPSYEKTIPSDFKALMDRTGPNHDITIREVFAKRRKEENIQDGRSIDERSFKRRPVVFIGHGGSDWCSLNLPLQKLWAIPMGFNIVDEKYYKWNVMLRTEDDKLAEIKASGKHLGECVMNGTAEYIGPKGICPCCHAEEFKINDLATGSVECLVCGMPGKLESDGNGGLTPVFNEEDKKHSLITDEGRLQHLKDMLGTGMKLRNLDRTEMDRRNEAMKSVLVPSRPEKK
ncbi:MAG: flavodoxin family protein [Lachnospiraceae bacterium]|nr:flavodoxin family protein [Lachnospiraceae bacterium]